MKSIVRSLAVEMALQQRATGRRIAQLRERVHLTQEAAADRAGVTLRAYQKWEAGGGIQFANLKRLAGALNTTVEEITGEADTSAAPDPFAAKSQLDRMEAALEDLNAKIDFILAALELREPAEDDGPARVVEAVRDAAARIGARREPAARPSPQRRATR